MSCRRPSTKLAVTGCLFQEEQQGKGIGYFENVTIEYRAHASYYSDIQMVKRRGTNWNLPLSRIHKSLGLGVEDAPVFGLPLGNRLCFNTFMSIKHLTSSQLRQIADLKEKIEALELQLAGIIVVGGKPHAPVQVPEPPHPSKPGKRTMSPAHKAKIRAAQQLR